MKLPVLSVALCAVMSVASYAQTSPTSTANITTSPASSEVLSTAAKHGSAFASSSTSTAQSEQNRATNQPAAQTASKLLATETDRTSYALGYDMGRSFQVQKVPVNINALTKGMQDALAGNRPLMESQAMQETLINFQRNLISKHQAQLANMAAVNEKEGAAFLTANKNKPGVKVLADGLQYRILKQGEGNSPADQDTVTVNYIGFFTNGQVFDSSSNRGKPSTFPVSQVIPGWTEALKMMKPGAIWEIYVPPALAYGNNAVGPIGPNQTLVFKIQLIAVNAATASPSQLSAQKPVEQK